MNQNSAPNVRCPRTFNELGGRGGNRRRPGFAFCVPGHRIHRPMIAALLLLVTSAAGASVSLDLGWRFHRGVPASPCSSPFNSNFTGQQCDGLSSGASAKTAADCEALCCADFSCEIWQFLPGGGSGAGCWFGLIPAQGCNPSAAWVSFANSSRGAQVPAACWRVRRCREGARRRRAVPDAALHLETTWPWKTRT